MEISIFSKLHKENNGNNKNIFKIFIFYSSFFFSDFTFYKEALCFIIFVLSLCSNTLTLESILECICQKFKKKHAHFKISSRDEVLTRLFFFFPYRDEISFWQKRVHSKRVFTREISSWDETCPRTKTSLSMVRCLLQFTRFCRD